MTTTYDPHHPAYLDEADVRGELARVQGHCNGCRRCTELCTVFPTLFDMLDGVHDHDAGLLTPSQQDRVIDQCYQCKLCYLNCPYVPGSHESEIDVPRLMLRATAMRWADGLLPARRKRTARIMGRPELLGRLPSRPAPDGETGHSDAGHSDGSLLRRAVAKLTGVSAVRLLPPVAKQRFSTWYRDRPKVSLVHAHARVTVFPTCVVEYQQPDIGKDLVKVYERNGIECEHSAAGCCGAAWLQAGDLERFRRVAEANVAVLAAEVRAGTDVVGPQPTCSYVIRREYPDHVGDDAATDARLVADHTYDASEFLMNIHRSGDAALDTDFGGQVPDRITYHAPCRLRAQDTGFTSRDLMRLIGADVTVVQQCSGMGGTWGLHADNEAVSMSVAARLGEQIDDAGGDVVTGDCHLANTAIAEQTSRTPSHPLQVVARAYGIPEEL